ncbi:glycosyltransferase family 2 protein [Acidicapsa ligni]|uniref:glycosyltransferase family 2 protein n=1 Tax=Acidicapsa ligni TaxID=542300 RepID=UPI0021E05EBE|nr:glycosyltransferase family 2 protein [Acidicapsa ligni]
MQITVVIPTYNRAEVLRKTLHAYSQQTGDHRILEILVVDDGSKDHTQTVAAECAELDRRVRYLKQSNRGLAAARNHAIRKAEGELILFGDDDIIPTPNMTAEHIAWHDINPEDNCGVLGYVPWLSELRPTPFMKWSALYGPQFNFGYFVPGKELGFQFGYFCNTSVHASFLREHGTFNEAFKTYGYEDIELSYRLAKKGYKLRYNPDACGYHNKYETLNDAIERVEKLYRSWPEFAQTEAGYQFLEMWRGGKQRPANSVNQVARKMLAPLKSLAIPMLRPLLDTHVPLPAWVYSQVFYHYVTSFATVVQNTEKLVPTV